MLTIDSPLRFEPQRQLLQARIDAMGWDGFGQRWRPYVPVAKRRAQAQRKMDSLRKQGVKVQPVANVGRKIAATFWGQAWCEHLESFSDFANRLPRGRTYVRNGSVCHLEISSGKVLAKVSGSSLYNLTISIKPLAARKWRSIKQLCSGQIGSLLELLQGNLSQQVMKVVTNRSEGLFPLPQEIEMRCDCPDWAVMCKHVAAALYGVGARLDQQPELLFKLRGVDHEELIAADAEAAVSAATKRGKSKRLATGTLSEVFGIDLAAAEIQTSQGESKADEKPRRRRNPKPPPLKKKSGATKLRARTGRTKVSPDAPAEKKTAPKRRKAAAKTRK